MQNKNDVNELITENLNLVRSIAHRFTRLFGQSFDIEYDDLFQQGVIGLHTAATRFDGAKFTGSKFGPYAYKWIRKHIQVFIDKQKKYKLTSDNRETFMVSLDSTIDNESTSDGYNYLHIDASFQHDCHSEFINQEEANFINSLIPKVLTNVEQIVIKMRFLSVTKETLNTVSKAVNLSIPRTRSIEQQALKKLKKYIAK
jgi:RNA polymerase sigma factor (sigma-70 family)